MDRNVEFEFAKGINYHSEGLNVTGVLLYRLDGIVNHGNPKT